MLLKKKVKKGQYNNVLLPPNPPPQLFNDAIDEPGDSFSNHFISSIQQVTEQNYTYSEDEMVQKFASPTENISNAQLGTQPSLDITPLTRCIIESQLVSEERSGSDTTSVSSGIQYAPGKNCAEGKCKCEDQWRKVCETLADHTFMLNEIRKLLLEKYVVKENLKFPVKFPMTLLSQMEDMEKLLFSDKKYVSSFLSTIESIGGKGGRDFVIRSLSMTMNDEVAELCSWTGAKNNFELQNKKFIAIIFRAINKNTGMNAKDFENSVKDWLRHARQRKERATMKTSKRSNIYSLTESDL